MGTVSVDYQQLLIGPNTVTLSWLYNTTGSCVAAKFRVDVYEHSDMINAESLTPFVSFESSTNSIIIESRFLKDGSNLNYFRISVINSRNVDCSTSVFHSLSFEGQFY